jgi:hypothetical protein
MLATTKHNSTQAMPQNSYAPIQPLDDRASSSLFWKCWMKRYRLSSAVREALAVEAESAQTNTLVQYKHSVS